MPDCVRKLPADGIADTIGQPNSKWILLVLHIPQEQSDEVKVRQSKGPNFHRLRSMRPPNLRGTGQPMLNSLLHIVRIDKHFLLERHEFQLNALQFNSKTKKDRQFNKNTSDCMTTPISGKKIQVYKLLQGSIECTRQIFIEQLMIQKLHTKSSLTIKIYLLIFI